MEIPTAMQLARGCNAFGQHEQRDAMYKTATFLVGHFWGRPAKMADSLGVLLLTWNQAFYRYGSFDFGRLEQCIAENLRALDDGVPPRGVAGGAAPRSPAGSAGAIMRPGLAT